jgi:hypothetical protein
MKLAVALGFAACLVLTGTASGQEVFSLSNTVKIGVLTDMSSLYSDIGGPGSVEAAKMAIADFGGTVNGKRIERSAPITKTTPIWARRPPISGSPTTASTRSPAPPLRA